MRKPGESGQTIVLFAMVLVAVVAMVGLVIDGGATYGQRRTQQNAADMAALAGGTIAVNGGDATKVEMEAKAVAAANFGNPDATVTVTRPGPGLVKVDITASHQNYFAGVVGQSTWPVSVTATAAIGVPTKASGFAPLIFSSDAFGPDGKPYSAYGTAPVPFGGTTSGDAPKSASDVAFTTFGDKVNSGNCKGPGDDNLSCYLSGISSLSTPLVLNDYIGQYNMGGHNDNFGDGKGIADPTKCTGSSSSTNVDTCLSGKEVVVPVVTSKGSGLCNDGTHNGGCFGGWALFYVERAEGKSSKTVTGYFVSGFSRSASPDGLCTEEDLTACPGFHGVYSLRLVN